jgi:hypothetical protein
MIYWIVAAHAFVLFRITQASPPHARSSCRYIPGDNGWPSVDTWTKFNTSIGGRLIATVPLATPCHEPSFEGQKCATLQEKWLFAPVQ